MAARQITVTGNEDMSAIASTAAGSDPGTNAVLIQIDDADPPDLLRQAVQRGIEKLIEEGYM